METTLITKLKIKGYRAYKDFTLLPNSRINLIAGANDSGKSTLMEAVCLALTGRINGRSASEEINPYWFNTDVVSEFIEKRKADKKISLPEIHIEVFLENTDSLQNLCGAINSDIPTNACPGVTLSVIPDDQYSEELESWASDGTPPIPVEYYKVDWRAFSDSALTSRPKQLATAFIDSSTIRSSYGIDHHLKNIIRDSLSSTERASISVAYRRIKASMSENELKPVNEAMADTHATLHDQPISLAMDQSARTSWEGAISPHVKDVPFTMSGQGQQAAIKISLAMNRHADRARYVMVEEPENHLTHTSLVKLISRMESLAGAQQQIFVATHSSFVINRLGLDGLHLLGDNVTKRLADLTPETVSYFQKLPGYDTLRMVLSDKVVLVEGPSDEIIFERIFKDIYKKRPMELGIDVLSMRGLSLHRCLELCAPLDKTVAALRDNDGQTIEDLQSSVAEWLLDGKRELFIGCPSMGNTLEPQLISHNDEKELRNILDIHERADLLTWMTREKTETAIRIADSKKQIIPPKYILDAIRFIHG